MLRQGMNYLIFQFKMFSLIQKDTVVLFIIGMTVDFVERKNDER